MKYEIPSGDILIHAGDFTMNGTVNEIEEFSKKLEYLQSKFSHIVLIAGNHELSFDHNSSRLVNMQNFQYEKYKTFFNQNPRIFFKNFIYLEDSLVELFGIKIYGSPWYLK